MCVEQRWSRYRLSVAANDGALPLVGGRIIGAGNSKKEEQAMTTSQGMSVEETAEVFERYAASRHSDVSVMAPDVVFRVMATGQEFRTPEGVLGMLNWFYHGAFEAAANETNRVVSEGKVAVEADFVGRHIGEFAGVPASGKDVSVPLAVVYDLIDGRITEGRVYFETPAFLAQVGAPG
jgi:steroid delta-isomerase-like uncharacterized protein